MAQTRTLFALLFCAACREDFQSLDSAMGELVEGLPETALIFAENAHICSSTACSKTAHDHRIALSLRPVQPARRNRLGDTIYVEGTFRLVRPAGGHSLSPTRQHRAERHRRKVRAACVAAGRRQQAIPQRSTDHAAHRSRCNRQAHLREPSQRQAARLPGLRAHPLRR